MFKRLCLLSLVFLAVPLSGRAQTCTDIHDFDTPFLASPQYSGILAQGRDGALWARLRGAERPGGAAFVESILLAIIL